MLNLVEELQSILGEKTKAKGKAGGSKGGSSLVKSLKKRGDVEDPEALAASIGREKYGAKKFSKMAAAARKKRGKK